MPKPRLKVSTREVRAERRPPNATGKNRARKGKYNAAGQHLDGHWFASMAEATRYLQLKVMQAEGKIDKLELQPVYQITISGKPITKYKADFRYTVLDPSGRTVDMVIEDVKGMVTDVYALKKKMVEAQYNIPINEIPARKVGEWNGRTP
jgi:hypothetical protein